MHKSLRTHLDISTANVTANDLDLLEVDADNDRGPDAPGATIPNVNYEYGAIIFVLHYDNDADRKEHILDVVNAGYSSAMVKVIKLAWKLDAAMVRLDRDADLCPDLDDCSG